MNNNHGLIDPHGGYRKLRSFQAAQEVYDLTVVSCTHHPRWRRILSSASFTKRAFYSDARSNIWNSPFSPQAASPRNSTASVDTTATVCNFRAVCGSLLGRGPSSAA